MSKSRKRYAQVGLGGRSWMYTRAVASSHAEHGELAGLCDVNPGRLEYANRRLAEVGHAPVPAFAAEEFDRMVAQVRPDVVIVTSKDSTHAPYICRALELGCEAISEKPMTIDAASCRKILETVKRTGRRLTVTFNYRYSPPRSQVRELLATGAIGEITSVDFCWLLDTRHGADYFRRWHRHRENSSSLLVHKATHHFDLVNWWIQDVPEEVFAYGSRRFYTPQTADRMGLQGRGERCLDCAAKDRCKFHLNLAGNRHLRSLYLDNERYDGYYRDRCVFGADIDIWDNMSVNVRYRCGAFLNYCLTAHSPWEGYRVAFNGTAGRLEHACCETSYTSGDGTVPGELIAGKTTITLTPAFSRPQEIPIRQAKGGHGGGDPVLLDDLFLPNPPEDPLGRKASHIDGTWSIMVGISACHSIDSGKPVKVAELLGDMLPI